MLILLTVLVVACSVVSSSEAEMERRHPPVSYISETNNSPIWNSSRSCPNYNSAREVRSAAYYDHGIGSSFRPQSSLSMDGHRYGADFESSHQHFMHQHEISSSPSITQLRPSYCSSTMAVVANDLANIRMDSLRVAGIKRRAPLPLMCDDEGYTYGYDSGASSSNPPLPSQYRPWDGSTYGSEDGFVRNVRSRYSQNFHLEPNSDRLHSSSHISQDIYLGSSVSDRSSGNPTRVISSSSLSYTTYSGSNVSRQLTRPIIPMSSSTRTPTDSYARRNNIIDAYRRDLLQTRNPGAYAPAQYESYTRARGTYHSNLARISLPYNAFPSQPYFEGREHSGAEATPSSRNHRLAAGRNGERSERSWNFDDEHRQFLHGDYVPVGLISEDVEADPFLDPWSLFDQHRDMRLDIDNMSYEELLDLGEMIGTVSTGVSEDAISKCVVETVFPPSNKARQVLQDASCVICLEEYASGERIGRLSCRHSFHFECVEKWLLTKDSCPICKTPAMAAAAGGP